MLPPGTLQMGKTPRRERSRERPPLTLQIWGAEAPPNPAAAMPGEGFAPCTPAGCRDGWPRRGACQARRVWDGAVFVLAGPRMSSPLPGGVMSWEKRRGAAPGGCPQGVGLGNHQYGPGAIHPGGEHGARPKTREWGTASWLLPQAPGSAASPAGPGAAVASGWCSRRRRSSGEQREDGPAGLFQELEAARA